MTSNEYNTYIESGLFSVGELEHISAVEEIVEEFNILLHLPLFIEHNVEGMLVSISPVMSLETKITRPDIDYLSFIGSNDKFIVDSQITTILEESSLPLKDDFKKINYDFINNSFEVLHVSESLVVNKDQDIADKVEKTLLSEEIKKKMQVALLSHSLVDGNSSVRKSNKIWFCNFHLFMLLCWLYKYLWGTIWKNY